MDRAADRTTRREILRLAVPAFLALVVEPLFLLADSAIVGHLGTTSLAALGVASTALLTASGLLIFLAYATTSAVARHVGASAPGRAVSVGMDGLYLALALGALTGAALYAAARPISAAIGASAATIDQAVTYLQVSALGVPSMLVILAVTGVLRGLQDTTTPLRIAAIGFPANVALNYLFVYPLGWGIAGSAWGTVIAQTGMAVGLTAALLTLARRYDARLAPHPAGVLRSALDGIPLLVRTLALRAVLLLTVWVAAAFGDAALAAHQVAFTIWGFLTFALDSLAIAAQALTGRSLGAGDREGTRATTQLMTRWGLGAGVVLGAVVLAVHRVLPALFTPDPLVRQALASALVVVAAGQVVSGVVFVLDGVLIGAGDGRYLAVGMVVALAAYLPLVLWLHAAGPALVGDHGAAYGLVVLWLAFHWFMVVRGMTLWWRARGDHWMVTGTR
ncbi:MAG: MATE family efflux transporter [Dermatophilaceae bacterium]